MTEIYKTGATSVGGRDGRVTTDDGVLDLQLHTPGAMGGRDGSTNPEQLFAAGYAACFNGALNAAARIKRVKVGETRVHIDITLGKDDEGNFRLGADIHVTVPEVDMQTARQLAEDAHNICPYSRATKGNIDSKLSVSTE